MEGDFVESDGIRPAQLISIHALRVEGDRADHAAQIVHFISIHALRVEGDQLR